MSRGSLPKLYDVLTPEERFRLMLHARAREDGAEVERLERTCPRYSYTMRDAEYLNRRELIETLALAVCLDLTQYLAKLQVAEAFGWAASETRQRAADRAERVANSVRRRATDQTETDHAEDWREASSLLIASALDPLEQVAARLGADLARETRGIWDGFARFCRAELDVPPETVIGALFAPMLARLERQREALDAAEPDPSTVDAYARMLTRGWRRVLGLQTEAEAYGKSP